MREHGYYWIKLKSNKNDPQTENGWEVAYYMKDTGWYSIWDGGDYQDNELEEINENILKPKY